MSNSSTGRGLPRQAKLFHASEGPQKTRTSMFQKEARR